MTRNSGIITDRHAELDIEMYERYRNGKTALVAQGGGQRGIFTAGVLDAFLLSNFDPFDEFYGTSAGALNLCAYLCRQHGMGKAFITDLTTSNEFFNLFRYIRKKQYLGLEWALERIQDYPYKLDLDMGKTALGARGAFAAVTNVDTLSDQYLPILGGDWVNTMVATCAIPKLYLGPVDVNGHPYVDGGVSASIPVQEAWRKNARNIIVIRTEPFLKQKPKYKPRLVKRVSNGTASRLTLCKSLGNTKFTNGKRIGVASYSRKLMRLINRNCRVESCSMADAGCLGRIIFIA